MGLPQRAPFENPHERPFSFGYYPALDGLRAFAVMGVLLYHAAPGFLPAGYLGVEVFFPLSGFLITAILLEDWQARGHIRFGNFYLRRLLRLFPALFFMVATVGIVDTCLDPSGGGRRAIASFWVLTYTGNWARAFGWFDLRVLAHCWSLGIEEQFYLLWPALLALALKRTRRLDRLAVAVACAGLAVWGYRIFLYRAGVPAQRLQAGFDTRADALLFGCAAALFFFARQPKAGATGSVVAGSGLLAIAAAMRMRWDWASFETIALASSLVPILASGLVFYLACEKTSWRFPARLLENRLLVELGKRSYGMYLWHFPVMEWVTRALPRERGYVWIPIYCVATYLLALVSSRWVETPFLRWKARLRGA